MGERRDAKTCRENIRKLEKGETKKLESASKRKHHKEEKVFTD